jgi:hypothetical protein
MFGYHPHAMVFLFAEDPAHYRERNAREAFGENLLLYIT